MKSRYLYITLDLLCLSITKVHVTGYTFPTLTVHIFCMVVQTELNTSEIRCQVKSNLYLSAKGRSTGLHDLEQRDSS